MHSRLWRKRLVGDCGSVTAEFAMVLPAVVMILVVAIQSLSLQGEQVRLIHRAAELASVVARGETVSQGQVTRQDDLVCVKLSAPTRFGFELSDTECARPTGY